MAAVLQRLQITVAARTEISQSNRPIIMLLSVEIINFQGKTNRDSGVHYCNFCWMHKEVLIESVTTTNAIRPVMPRRRKLNSSGRSSVAFLLIFPLRMTSLKVTCCGQEGHRWEDNNAFVFHLIYLKTPLRRMWLFSDITNSCLLFNWQFLLMHIIFMLLDEPHLLGILLSICGWVHDSHKAEKWCSYSSVRDNPKA